MGKKISSLHDHFIVCGFGRIGSMVTRELLQEKHDTVIVENDPELLEQISEKRYFFIHGDATNDDNLVKAGITTAKAIITTLNTDAKNLYVTLASKQLNPSITVIARAEKEDSLQKLRYAGADKVLTPYLLGGIRMAQMVLRPTVTNFLEMAMHGENIELQMEELELSAGSALWGKIS
jgi:voltage-gated potassium channel